MKAEQNNTVKVHYTGKLDDGTVFDSSEGRDPLEFELGAGRVIPGFEAGVTGMEVGEKKTVVIPPDEAYGPADDQLIQTIERSQIPDDIPMEEGLQLQSQTPDGQMMVVTVVSFDDDNVTLNANHPLAGKTLTFDLELVEIA